MSDLKCVTAPCFSENPKEFEEELKRIKAAGYRMVSISGTNGPTMEQRTSLEDGWETFTVINPALF